MPKEKVITQYECVFCKKKYQVKNACIKHETACFKNPINDRPCFGCRHFGKSDIDVYYDHPEGGDYTIPKSFFYCSAKKVFLHTPQNEIKGNAEYLSDFENLPMPITCDLFDNDRASELPF